MGERHGSPFVVLWTVPLQSATVDFGDCLFDVEPSAEQVDVADAEASQLGPPESAVGEDEYGESAGACVVGELVDLLGGQVTPSPLVQRRQVDAFARVAG